MGKQLSPKELENFSEITDVTFDHDGAHLAMCHSLQRSANGYTGALITKDDEQDEELIKVLEQITVTMSMEEYLTKFFHMYYSDAELLTKLMGMETEREYYMNEDDDEMDMMSYDDMMMKRLDEKVSKIEILRSCENVNTKDMTEDQLSITQKVLSQFLKGIAKHEDEFKQFMDKEVNKTSNTPESFSSTASADEGKDASSSDEVITKTSGETNEENNVTTKTEKVEKSAEAVALEKAQQQLKDMEAKLEKAAKMEADFEKAAKRIEALEKKDTERLEKSYQNFADTLTFVDSEQKAELVKSFMSLRGSENEVVVATMFQALEKAQETLKAALEAETGVDTPDGVEKSSSDMEEFIKAKFADKKYL